MYLFVNRVEMRLLSNVGFFNWAYGVARGTVQAKQS